MEDWKKKIIMNNREKLIQATSCSYTLLAKLLLGGILNEDDFEQLVNLRSNRKSQSELLYELVLARERGFEMLLKSLNEDEPGGWLRRYSNPSTANKPVRVEITRLWELEEKPLLHCATFTQLRKLFHELVANEVKIGKNESLKSRDKWGSSVLHNAVLCRSCAVVPHNFNGFWSEPEAGEQPARYRAAPRCEAWQPGALYLFISQGCDVKARNGWGHPASRSDQRQEPARDRTQPPQARGRRHAMNSGMQETTDDPHIQDIYDSFHSGGW
ncbi:hypothetical protein Ocin01_19392 [Orchesella cincta]|uniref:CARD domain-containing protein n=1 Tax=Orchesella cincta TaxID=48709 RepID=A0A1D2M2T6_ORCCI|nr:hypothetical protein Ocin01_19392 [Orchesella cincta]